MLRKRGLLIFKRMFVFILTACGDTEQAEEEGDEDLVVGDTVKFEGLKIMLNEAREGAGGEFDDPEEDLFVVAN